MKGGKGEKGKGVFGSAMYVVLYKRPAREGVVLQEKGSTQEKGGGGLDAS